MHLILPKGLDLHALVATYPPSFSAFKVDKLAYILHAVATIPVYTKKSELIDDYVPLSSRILNTLLGNYKPHLNYAVKLGLLQKHPTLKYQVGEHCTLYQFTESYRDFGAVYYLKDFVLRRKLNSFYAELKATTHNYGYLNKWFTKKLVIDSDLVLAFLEEEWFLKYSNPHLRDYSLVKQKAKSPFEQYVYSKLSVQFLESHRYLCKVDSKVYRYHSNLTNMRGLLRNAITYDGQPMVAVDLSNSQPYLSLLLLQLDFWEGFLEYLTRSKRQVLKYPEKVKNSIKYIWIYMKLEARLRYLEKDINKENYLIMLVKMMVSHLETRDEGVYERYRKEVCQGTLYSYLERVFQGEDPQRQWTRNDAKIAVLQAFFSDNRFLHSEEALPKRLFKKEFEEVYEVLRLVKQLHKTLLPILLQNLESLLVLEVIAKRLSKEYPKMPLFSIHDSLVTTVGHEAVVARVIQEELVRYIGSAPHLKIEYWKSEKLTLHLEQLKERLRE